jgi:hypothetical protein
MSNYFYTEIDANLRNELNARGKSGMFSRTTNDLEYMLGKIANVEISAYEGDNTLEENKISTLGGETSRSERFQPSGPNGFLSNPVYKKPIVKYYTDEKDPKLIKAETEAKKNIQSGIPTDIPSVGYAYDDFKEFNDDSRRVGPYLTGVDVTIGDHSMALLNKATVKFVVPNPTRDLDDVERIWLRPGRFCKIQIVHPDSAIVSDTPNLQPSTLPNKERLKTLYGDSWPIDDFLSEVGKMNQFTFEGLITSFDFSYNEDGSVDVTLSLSGRSAVFADVSMIIESAQEEDKTNPKPPEVNTDPSLGEEITYTKEQPPENKPFVYENSVTGSEYTNFKNTILSKGGLSAATQSLLLNTGSEYYSAKRRNLLDELIPSSSTDRAAIDEYDEARVKDRNEQQSKVIQENLDAQNAYNQAKNDFIRNEKDKVIQQFSEKLHNNVQRRIDVVNQGVQSTIQVLTEYNRLNSNRTDEWILDGPPYYSLNDSNELITPNDVELLKNKALQESGNLLFTDPPADVTAELDNIITAPSETYITLAVLINFINEIVESKLGTANVVNVKFDDAQCFSNYHPNLVSCVPEDILLLPKNFSSGTDMNSYGNLSFYEDAEILGTDTEWPGVYEISETQSVIYPSRIFINMSYIHKTVKDLVENGTGDFKLKTLIGIISRRLRYATGGAIVLKLISHPKDINQFILADTKFVQPGGPQNLEEKENKTIEPYSVPMFANHPYGSIVHSFNMSAKLPASAKNLAFVLNTSEDISDDELAPYLNFMYTAGNGNAKQINELRNKFANKFQDVQEKLQAARNKYGEAPGKISDNTEALVSALVQYMKYPTKDIQSSQQLIAPMFPFEANFTIDGINGLRFGDVLVFDVLPQRYRVNTVFSVGQITHTVDSSGMWTTNVKTFMRAQIDGST